MITNFILDDKAASHEDVMACVPDIYKHSNTKLLGFDNPRIMKSHEYLDQDIEKSSTYPEILEVLLSLTIPTR